MRHNSKLPHVGTTIFSVMSSLANKYNAINLSQGFPNFKSDSKLTNLVSKAMNSGFNQYAPMPGNVELREAISKKFKHSYDAHYHPESEITVTAGATQAIFTVISAFVKQDDEVIVFKPAYDCYEPTVELYGGIPVQVQLKAPDYAVNWNAVRHSITPKTKLIIINKPKGENKKAYKNLYGEYISTSTISRYIHYQGYSFKRARTVLTSPDPEYRIKLNKIKKVLSKKVYVAILRSTF